jgi:Leucine-rich repeat (LRR) protein
MQSIPLTITNACKEGDLGERDNKFIHYMRPWLEANPHLLRPLNRLSHSVIFEIIRALPPFQGGFFKLIKESALEVDQVNKSDLHTEIAMMPGASLQEFIEWFQDHPEALMPVEKLFFTDRSLTGIPEVFCQLIMAHLEELSFDGNEISLIPDSFIPMSFNLKSFSIERNRLEEIPHQLTQFWQSIRILSFDENRIRKIPDELGKESKTLTVLHLNNNLISSLSERWAKTMCTMKYKNKLRAIYLAGNCLVDKGSTDALDLLNSKEIALYNEAPRPQDTEKI